MRYLLALDQGTSSTRAMVYDVNGMLLLSSQRTHAQFYPHPGWVEHNPEELWQNCLAVIKEVLLQVPVHQIAALGITNQRETTLIWNKKTGECLAPAMVWQDRRTQDYCCSMQESSALISNKTGLLLDPYFSASKLHWLLENNSEAQILAQRGELAFGTVDSFLIWRLTKGNHFTDITNASRTMLFNIHEKQWDKELLSLFDIPESILPEVKACDSFFGNTDKNLFGMAIPITGVAGDQQAALIGQGCFNEGMIKATFGTGGFLLLNTGDQMVSSTHKLLTTIAYQIQDQTVYGLEGSIYHAGTSIKWLRDEMKLITHAAETEQLAESLASNEGVYFISSFTGLGAPHWLSTSGATISGLSRTSNRAHFARAVLEGVAYQTREVLQCMKEDSDLKGALLRVDGGMAKNHWFLQFLADQCQVIVQRPDDIETTAKGAAFLAGLGCGHYGSCRDIQRLISAAHELLPTPDEERINEEYQGWVAALKQLKRE